MRLSTSLCLFAAAILAQASSSFAKAEANVITCNANTIPTTCPSGQYCQAAKKGPSTCAKKQDGGAPCSKDDSCRSEICFISKTVGGKKIKRNCARFPAINFELGAQCTLSPQCESGFCDAGFCKKPVPAGEKCPKDSGCAQLSIGAECLHGKETYIVYDSAGKKSTKNLSAGHCSYVRNLGEGMKCSSDANCYAKKFTCSKSTHKCTAIPTGPKTNLPYKDSCSADSECASGTCKSGKCACVAADCSDSEFCSTTCKSKLFYQESCQADVQCASRACASGKCGCSLVGPECNHATQFCGGPDLTCQAKLTYGETCTLDNQCAESASCVPSVPPVRRLAERTMDKICGCTSDDSCDVGQFCDTQTNLCIAKKPYGASSLSASQCASGKLTVDNTCACTMGGSDCDAETAYCSDLGTCNTLDAYGAYCSSAFTCKSDVCVSSPMGRRGAESFQKICGCLTTDSPSPCDSLHYCDGESNLCVSLDPAGTSCETSDTCMSGVCNSSHLCGCTFDSDCDTGSQFCDTTSSTCTAKLDYQQDCTSSSHCADGGICQSSGVDRRGPAPSSMMCTCPNDQYCVDRGYGICTDSVCESGGIPGGRRWFF